GEPLLAHLIAIFVARLDVVGVGIERLTAKGPLFLAPFTWNERPVALGLCAFTGEQGRPLLLASTVASRFAGLLVAREGVERESPGVGDPPAVADAHVSSLGRGKILADGRGRVDARGRRGGIVFVALESDNRGDRGQAPAESRGEDVCELLHELP